jgi:Pyruvate phosphate dikinase, AMP/ATP-binding domain
MDPITCRPLGEFYANFKDYRELMAVKVREILLVSSPYDAFILEEDGSLASRIINEYSGLNLSLPPRVTRIASAKEALALIETEPVDMVLTMPHLGDMDAFSFGIEVKKKRPSLPVILLAHGTRGVYPPVEDADRSGIDKIFIWSGNSDLLLALVKNVEDRLNVDHDTEKAGVRVLILVEDAPAYYSSFLPLIYKEIVLQTQAVLVGGLNEEDRLLKMRARPKILHAETFEEAMAFYERYGPYLFGIISDTRLPRGGQMGADAGVSLLARVRKEVPDLPLLLLSNEPANRECAEKIPALFLDKNSPRLLDALHDFFMAHLGFGDFVFRMPDGSEVDRASTLRELEEKLAHIPDASLRHHADRNHFSGWILARSEIGLGSAFRAVNACQFESVMAMRRYIIGNIRDLRKLRQKGVVAQFNAGYFDAGVMEFVKIGQGSLGGKARSLAFMSALLHQNPWIRDKFPKVNIRIPRTLVIATDAFEAFIEENDLHALAREEPNDDEIRRRFIAAAIPRWLKTDLRAFLTHVKVPLSVRSSSLLEDAQFQPYAGLYETFMIPNAHEDFDTRLEQLITAVKLVCASTFYEGPRAFSRSIGSQPREVAMAVIVQALVGDVWGDFFYPAISGVGQSHNFYPVAPMTSEDGVAHIALGLGKTVVEGERALRFSPRYPKILPHFSNVDDILANAQRTFYALRMRRGADCAGFDCMENLEKRDIDTAEKEYPVIRLASTYSPDDHRLRDSGYLPGPKVITFAQVLKYDQFPLAPLLADLLELGERGMGCPVEIEFAVKFGGDGDTERDEFAFLQMRPMAAATDRLQVAVTADDLDRAVCRSEQALGNGVHRTIADVVYVKPDAFDAAETVAMAAEIGQVNAGLVAKGRPYLLAGPGRWGSSDRWLGIPVRWQHISGVAAMVEVRNDLLKADPSQGSHFFQNITSLGIQYLTVTEGSHDFFLWRHLDALAAETETTYLRHVRFSAPLTVKIDGRSSRGVVMLP